MFEQAFQANYKLYNSMKDYAGVFERRAFDLQGKSATYNIKDEVEGK